MHLLFSTNNAFKALSSCLARERHVTKFKHPSAKLESALARYISESRAHTTDIASGAITVRLTSPPSNAQKLTEHLTAPSFKFCLLLAGFPIYTVNDNSSFYIYRVVGSTRQPIHLNKNA